MFLVCWCPNAYGDSDWLSCEISFRAERPDQWENYEFFVPRSRKKKLDILRVVRFEWAFDVHHISSGFCFCRVCCDAAASAATTAVCDGSAAPRAWWCHCRRPERTAGVQQQGCWFAAVYVPLKILDSAPRNNIPGFFTMKINEFHVIWTSADMSVNVRTVYSLL